MSEAKESSHLSKKNDFIELEFLGRNLINREVFDTNILHEAKKINPDIKETKPLIICISKGMVVKGLDESLESKEIGKKYTIKLSPDKAFGKRDPKLIRLIPMKMFTDQKILPQPGMTLALDNNLVRVASVSGGRVLVDFNNPLAGKDVEYDFTIKKQVHDIKEKIESVQKFLFGQAFDFDIEEKEGKRIIVFKDLKLAPILQAFRQNFKELLDMDVEILEKKKEAKEEKMQEKEIKKSSP